MDPDFVRRVAVQCLGLGRNRRFTLSREYRSQRAVQPFVWL
jgi:hypothetical protein